MNGLATTGMDGARLLQTIACLRDSVEALTKRPGYAIVVSDLSVLRPAFAFISGASDVQMRSRERWWPQGWELLGMPVVVDPTCPPDTLYVLPAP